MSRIIKSIRIDLISVSSYFLFRNGLRHNVFEAGVDSSVYAYARGWALLVRFDSIDWWIGTISRLEGTHTHICKYVYIHTGIGWLGNVESDKS